jgi:predicted PolB exonuclease-like 3'-5' exonuclease
MALLFLDIETIPAPDEEVKALKFLYSRKLEKKAKKKEVSEEVEFEGKTIDKFETFYKNTSFDGGFGRILCIAYAIDDGPLEVICYPDDERHTLFDFWKVAAKVDGFVGHNVMEFDLRFIYQRCVKFKLKPSWDMFPKNAYDPRALSFARYRSQPIFDTMKEWTKWGQNHVGLEHIALALGIPTPKDGIDGSQVFDFYKAGKIKEICEYCKRDVEVTRAVYRRMTFVGI